MSDTITARRAGEHEQLSRTHETGLCRICFDKQAELEGK